MKSNALKPELYVKDFVKSLNFYTEILNFKIEYQRENPKFAFLSFQESQIMIQEIDPNEKDEYITGDLQYPLGRGINFQIHINSIQALHDSVKKNNYPIRKDIHDSWYKVNNILRGCRQILLQDPDGYLLRFSEDLGKKIITS